MKFQVTMKSCRIDSLLEYACPSSSLWNAFSSIENLSIHEPPFCTVTVLSSSVSKVSMCSCIGCPSTSSTLFTMSCINWAFEVRAG